MKTKTTLRYHLTPVRMAIIKSTRDKCWQGYGEKRTLVLWWWECKLVQPLWKTVRRFFKKLKMKLPYDPEIPLLSAYPKEMKTEYWKDIFISIFIEALFAIAKIWKQPKCLSTNEWIKKMWFIYVCNGLLFSHEKEGNPAICDNMDGPWSHYTEISQTEKDKHCLISLICEIQKSQTH